jgi:hypothetical protein
MNAIGNGVDLEFWRGLQGEVTAWGERNFPISIGRPEDPLAGFVEEFGELADAVAKRDREAAVDAVSDAMIYCADLCGKLGLDLGSLVQRALATDENDTLIERDDVAVSTEVLRTLGKLHHHFLKRRQGIRTNEDHEGEIRRCIARLIAVLWDVYGEVRVDRECPFDAAVRMTWAMVIKRDWKKNPTTGTAS